MITLQTKRLTIAPLLFVRLEHLAALNDKEYIRYSEQRHLSHGWASQRAYLDRMGMDGHAVLEITGKHKRPAGKRGRVAAEIARVGTMSCYIDPHNKVVDMGIMICPEFARTGYGLEAWQAVLDYWLNSGNMIKAEAGCHELNRGMSSILYRTMVREGLRPAHFLDANGRRSAMLCFGRRAP